jgi:hypothetical protein
VCTSSGSYINVGFGDSDPNYPTTCSCPGTTLSRTVNVIGGCSVSSDTGSCSGNGTTITQNGITGHTYGSCCVCAIPGAATSPVGFTSAMISGRSLQETFTSGSATYSFNANGSVTITGTHNGTGTWKVNGNGTLTLTFPTDSLTYTLLANNGTSLTVSYHHGTASVEEATGVTMTFGGSVSARGVHYGDDQRQNV